MNQDQIELRGLRAIELQRLDRILAELARPAVVADAIDPATRERLMDLGIVFGEASRRSALIARVWDRKRDLIHRMSAAGDWNPLPPSA